MDSGVMLFMFLGIGAVALFSFLGVIIWSAFRWKEREAFYRTEMVKKIAEAQGAGATVVLDFLREQENKSERDEREKVKVAGLITMAVGAALLIFLRYQIPGTALYLSGLFPLFIGFILFAAPYMFGRRE